MGRHLRSCAAPHPGTAASSAFNPLLHTTLPLHILHPSSSPPSTRRYSPRSPPFTRLFPIFLHPFVLSLFLRFLSPSYLKNRANPFRSFPCVFPLQPTLGATHEIAFQLFYSLLPLTSESSPRGGFFASLCLLLRCYPLPPPFFFLTLSLPSPVRCQLADPPSQCRRTRCSPKKKKKKERRETGPSTILDSLVRAAQYGFVLVPRFERPEYIGGGGHGRAARYMRFDFDRRRRGREAEPNPRG